MYFIEVASKQNIFSASLYLFYLDILKIVLTIADLCLSGQFDLFGTCPKSFDIAF